MSTFYREMNYERINSRWHDWEGHRNEIKIMINKTLGDISKMESVIVLGAGNCDDLDIPFLCDVFSQIALVDIDEASLKEAVQRQEPQLSHQLRTIGEVDFTKLDQVDFYNRFNSLLLRNAISIELCAFLRTIPYELQNCSVLDKFKASFSVVISSAVYTQIFYIHILTMFSAYVSNYSTQEIREILDELIALREHIVRSYNELILSLVKPDGFIIVWSDVVKLDETNPFPEEYFYQLKTEKDRIKFLFEMAGKQGREAAVIGFKDLHDKLQYQEKHFACWIWPFNDSRHYITFGLSGKVNQ